MGISNAEADSALPIDVGSFDATREDIRAGLETTPTYVTRRFMSIRHQDRALALSILNAANQVDLERTSSLNAFLEGVVTIIDAYAKMDSARALEVEAGLTEAV